MKQIILLSIFSLGLFASTKASALAGCRLVQTDNSFTESEVCESEGSYFSKSCSSPENCSLLDQLSQLADQKNAVKLFSETQSPTYRLCYLIQAKPIQVKFVKNSETSNRLICLAKNKDFLEADELMKIYFEYRRRIGTASANSPKS